jgi:glycosyltransferase involved in cell wall biosynthesis
VHNHTPAKPLKVLHIVESAAGGTGRHVLDLAEGMIARGHEVHLAHSTRRIDQLFVDRLATIRGARVLPLPIRTSPHPADLAIAWTLRRYMKHHGPFDLVHGHSSKGGALARLAAFGKRARAVYTLHGLIMMDPGLHPLKRAFYLAVERLLALRTSRIIAVSPEEARAAVRVGLGEHRVALVPNGVGPADLAPRDRARRTLGVSDDAHVIGFVGRLVDQKAPDVLLKAFAITANAAPRARLALVGAGPLEPQMRELAASLHVADRIHWLGERDARTVLAGFDVFAISSRKEGLPYVVLEAMAAGKPVVATSSAGVEILVTTGYNGHVVAPGDYDAFARGLTQLATDPALLARCGAASLARAGEFTVDAMVDRTLAAYTDRAPLATTAPASLAVSHDDKQFIADRTRDEALV